MPQKSAFCLVFMDRRTLHFQLAQHYGRKCRLVFPHGDWTQHEAHIASGWAYMGRELPWDQARDAVHSGWEMVGFDEEAIRFAAINDELDDAPGDTRRVYQ
jgi:hypothetical protein